MKRALLFLVSGIVLIGVLDTYFGRKDLPYVPLDSRPVVVVTEKKAKKTKTKASKPIGPLPDSFFDEPMTYGEFSLWIKKDHPEYDFFDRTVLIDATKKKGYCK